MILAAATTQPVWTPEAVGALIEKIAYILIPALAALLFALERAYKAIRTANAAQVKADATAQQVTGMQQQITAVALQTTPTVVVTPTTPTPIVTDDKPKGS